MIVKLSRKLLTIILSMMLFIMAVPAFLIEADEQEDITNETTDINEQSNQENIDESNLNIELYNVYVKNESLNCGVVEADISSDISVEQVITLTATPYKDYKFIKFKVYDSNEIEYEITMIDENIGTFIMPSNDVIVEGVFELIENEIINQEELNDNKMSLLSNQKSESDPITYLYRFENEKQEKTITKDEYVLLVDVTGSELSEGTYVVDRDITISDRRLVVNGTVNIILCDGFTLTCKQGITVATPNTLYIYGQENETGKLIASTDGQALSAAIGGGYYQATAGTIHLCSGTIEAIGGSDGGAGIGGGNGGSAGTINIYGGNITSSGGVYAAGIGAGDEAYGGIVNIWNGNIKTTGGEFGAGIGSGDQPGNAQIMTVNIKGGTVEAIGGDEAAGIGGGNEGNGANVTIEGEAHVVAKGGRQSVGEGAGIGGGDEGDGGIVTINGGYVEAVGGYRAAGIGGGADGSNTRVYINGGEVHAHGGGVANIGTRQSGGAGIGGGAYGYGGVIIINGGEVETRGFWGGAGIGGGYGAGVTTIAINDGNVSATGEQGGAGIGGGSSGNVGNLSISGGDVYAEAKSSSSSTYGAGAAIGSGNEGYIANLSITGGTIKALCDSGNYGAAAIGGGNKGYFGNIKIEGGTITSAYALDGAGIGSGSESEKKSDQPVAKITISGGTITRSRSIAFDRFSSTGAGIGSGQYALSPVNIEISGGNIYAYSGTDGESGKHSRSGAAIGSGYGSPIGLITISGGTIFAERGKGCTNADPIGYYDDVQNSVYPNIIFNYDEAQIRNEKGEGSDKRVKNTQYDENISLSRRLALLENDSDWVEIKPCDNQELEYEIISAGVDGKHKTHCNYCLEHDNEGHTHSFDDDNKCICGYYRYVLTFSDGQANGNSKDNYIYPVDILVDGSVNPNTLIRLSNYAPTFVLAGKKFTGWKVENDPTGTIYNGTESYVIASDTKFIAQWVDYVGISVVLSSIDGPLAQIDVGEIADSTSINNLYLIALNNGMQNIAEQFDEYILSTERGSKPMNDVTSMLDFNNLSGDNNTVANLQNDILYVAMLKKINDVEIQVEAPVCGTVAIKTGSFPPYDQSNRPVITPLGNSYEIKDRQKIWINFPNDPPNSYPAGNIEIKGDNTHNFGVTIDSLYGYSFVPNVTNITLTGGASPIEDTINVEKYIITFNGEIKGVHDYDEWQVISNATCSSEGVETRICKAENCNHKQERSIEIDENNHDYGNPSYTWSTDNSEVIAKMVCSHNDEHIISETVNTQASIIEQATCTEKGKIKYTALFENDDFILQTKVVEIDALNHDWDNPTYEWSNDNSSVTAKRICKNDESHIETETVDTTFEITKEATETEEGIKTYKASFTNSAFETQIKTESIPKIVFEYSNIEGNNQVWTKGGNTTADFTFKRSINDQVSFNNFKGIKVDGKDVDPTNYIYEKGSVIVKLKPSYLETLSLNNHTITAIFTDGQSSASFKIVDQSKAETRTYVIPRTGID